MTRVLVAGVGNIFLSDDGFGCEVVRALAGHPLPEGVEVVDFGIRGVHLAYQLLDGYDVLVLVDAAPRGHRPGTVSLLDVDRAQIPDAAPPVAEARSPLLDAHGMEPAAILGLLGVLGGRIGTVRVVAGEPETVAEGIGLSASVTAAIPAAVDLVLDVVHRVCAEEVST